MANRYWVGGTGTWSTATTNWSATSGGASGATAPGTADIAIFDSASNVAGGGASYVVTRTATTGVLGLTMAKPSATSATVTLAGTAALSIGTSGISLTSAAEVVWTLSGALTLSGTTAVCATGGAVVASAVTVSTGAVVTLSGDFSTSSTITCTTTGIINPNSFICKCSNILFGTTTTRTLAFGTGAFELTGTTSATYPSTGPGTWTAITGTPRVIMSGATTNTTRTLNASVLATATLFPQFLITAGSGTSSIAGVSGAQIGNLIFSGYTGSATLTNFTIRGNLTLVSGMTATGTASFGGTAGSTQTLTTGGVSLAALTIAITGGGGLALAQDTTVTGTTTLTSGALGLAGYALTTSIFASSNSNTRSIDFVTTGSIKVTGGSGTTLDIGTTTSLTFASIGTIYAQPVGSAATLSIGSGLSTYPNIYIYAGNPISVATLYCNNFVVDPTFGSSVLGGTIFALGNVDTRTANPSSLSISSTPNTAGTYSLQLGTASYSALTFAPTVVGVTAQLSGAPTATGGITFTGAGATTTFDLQSSVLTASSSAITINATNSMTLAMGTGYFVQSNSGIRTVLAVTAGANLTVTGSRRIDLDATGTGTRTVAIAGMTSINAFDVNVSRSAVSGSINFGSSTVRSLNFTSINTPSNNSWNLLSSSTLTVTGSLTLFSSMILTPSDNTAILLMSSPSGSYSVTTNGVQMPQMTFGANGDTATWTLQDSFTNKVVSNRLGITLAGGTLNTNSQTMTIGSLDASSGNVSTLTLGSSAVTVNRAADGATWNCSTSSNLTVNSGTSTITFNGGARHGLFGGNKIWPTIINGGSGELQISNNNTFNDIQGNGQSYAFAGNSTQTVSNFSATSSVNLNLISGTTPATLSKSSGTVSLTNSFVRGSNATGGATWLAYYKNGNTNSGYNSGWMFSDGSDSFFDFF